MFQEKIRALLGAINRVEKLQQDFDKYKAKVARRERRWASIVSGYRVRSQELQRKLDEQIKLSEDYAITGRELVLYAYSKLIQKEVEFDAQIKISSERLDSWARSQNEVSFLKDALAQAKDMLEDREQRIATLKMVIPLAIIAGVILEYFRH